ncbi:ATP-dependent Clp protease ATP-binding subunit [Cyclobacterium sp. GBPx2]|uniref:ATP-dependent Clp protease ATP-binding subunit n=1 Tax=Cyclobacterium plantarum TaxID=2716263 RepID=A0ABX0H9C4_9BACT|nr:ATP-dependent Clp protease ATP-binding subunit [Cyclobacterium plantarum]
MHLSEDLRNAIKIAQAIARENRHAEFVPSHLLKALLHPDIGLQPNLNDLDQDIYYLEEWAEVRMENQSKSMDFQEWIAAGPQIREVMNEAESIRMILSKDSIDPVHVLAAISTPGVAYTYEQLKTFPLKREDLISRKARDEEFLSALAGENGTIPGKSQTSRSQKVKHALLKYCREKTLMAREGKLDAIVGRENEIRIMSEILCRRSKPNVLLVGDPGVGKSALADGFALAIIQKKVPSHLQGVPVFELDTGSLVAGASYKGEVEERLKSIISEIKQFDRAILFIDEIHGLLDKQSAAAGSANLLKPELARGEITVVGATTLDEYRKFIEPDEAFNRRFELLKVEEPSSQNCFHMLKAVLPYYEQHHELDVPDASIHEAIHLAKRYIKERKLPDAGLDLLDRTMAALRLFNENGTRSIEDLMRRFQIWCEEDRGESPHGLEDWKWFFQQARQDISPLLWENISTDKNQDAFLRVEQIREHFQNCLDKMLTAASIKHTSVEKRDIAAIVSQKTGIPLGKVESGERERLLQMESVLRKRVVGQDHAIRSISDAVLESRAGLGKAGQPVGSFFFLGPTGTGKTELAKSLAEFLFQDEDAMIRFDMSEFKEAHAAALLYGAPPGYVGYEEGGLLVNKIRQKPYAVVLFDEIEKAHASVFDVFLQILDEGKLHDKLGKEGDFSNALILFTSNIGSQFISEKFQEGTMPSAHELLEKMGDHFRPEFLGRITEIIPFAPINATMAAKILDIQLKSLYGALEKQSIHLDISAAALKLLAHRGYHPRFGARPLSGLIRTALRRPLSQMIIRGELKAGDSIQLDLDHEQNLQWILKPQCLLKAPENK